MIRYDNGTDVPKQNDAHNFLNLMNMNKILTPPNNVNPTNNDNPIIPILSVFTYQQLFQLEKSAMQNKCK